VIWPDGTVRSINARGTFHFRDGQPQRMTGVFVDVTERKAAEQRQRLLIDELNHRVKNTLATVQSIAAQTLRSTASYVLLHQGGSLHCREVGPG
jgi:hypothetical protein